MKFHPATAQEIDDEDYQCCDDCGGSGMAPCENCGDDWNDCCCGDRTERECDTCEGQGMLGFEE